MRSRIGLTAGLASLCLLCLTGGSRVEAQSADPIVATVNGDAIPMSEFFERLQRVRAQDFIVTVNPLTVKNLNAGQLLLDQMINERLTLQWASKTNQMPTDAEVLAELNRLKAQPSVGQALARHEMSEDTLKYGLRYTRARFNLATTAVSVSPDEVQKYYQEHLSNYSIPERWNLLALSTRKSADLPKIQADLKAGKPFADVVKSYTEDPNILAKGGDLGQVSSTDPNLPAPIKDAVKTLKDGQTSPPVRLDLEPAPGKPKITVWWIMRLVKREPATTRPFADVKTQAEQALMLERAGGIQVADKKIADFRALSDIKINLTGYEMLVPARKKS